MFAARENLYIGNLTLIKCPVVDAFASFRLRRASLVRLAFEYAHVEFLRIVGNGIAAGLLCLVMVQIRHDADHRRHHHHRRRRRRWRPDDTAGNRQLAGSWPAALFAVTGGLHLCMFTRNVCGGIPAFIYYFIPEFPKANIPESVLRIHRYTIHSRACITGPNS